MVLSFKCLVINNVKDVKPFLRYMRDTIYICVDERSTEFPV